MQNRTIKTVGIRLEQLKFGKTYPEDVKYNVCQVGKHVIHNFKYTEPKIIEFIEKQNLQKIQIAQGYSNCSIAVISENAVIVSDKAIAETLTKHKIDVLCLDSLPDIKLLNEKHEYSQMKGFIGGAMARVEDKMMVFGDLRKIDKHNKIREFIRKYNLEIVDFPGLDVMDYGGIMVM